MERIELKVMLCEMLGVGTRRCVLREWRGFARLELGIEKAPGV